MPWCEDCAKYFTPSAMHADGTCPSCGRPLERTQTEPRRRRAASPDGDDREPITAKNIDLHRLAAGEDGDAADARAPWHFKLLLVLLALYLTWRIVDLFI